MTETSHSVSLGKSAYVANYVVIGNRVIGSVSLFGEKIRDFNVKLTKYNSFQIKDIEKDKNGFPVNLTFSVSVDKTKVNETLLEKAIEHASQFVDVKDMTFQLLTRLAVTYYAKGIS